MKYSFSPPFTKQFKDNFIAPTAPTTFNAPNYSRFSRLSKSEYDHLIEFCILSPLKKEKEISYIKRFIRITDLLLISLSLIGLFLMGCEVG